MAKAIREAYGEALVKYGSEDSRVVVLDADVSSSTKSGMFRTVCSGRFFNCGISESAMMGMAAGLAQSGKIPFVNTFAVFLSTIGAVAARTFLSYSGLNVKLMGGYAGLSAGYDGPTHHALEDISMMRTLPGMTVLVASDEQITDWMVKECIEREGPMYVRLSREAAPACHPDGAEFQLGRGFVVREGTDASVIACGILVSKAVKAAEILEKEGISLRVVDMFCIKPIDEELILQCAEKTGMLITAEEHSVIGGLGGAVAEVLARHGSGAPLIMLGMQDRHAESGPYEALLSKYGMDEHAIVSAVISQIRGKTK